MMIGKLKNLVRLQRQKLLQIVLHLFSGKFEVTSKNALIIAPHPDDETFGCAGLITQKSQMGVEVFVLFLTNGEKSLQTVPLDEIRQMRKKSATEASVSLGVRESNILWMDYPDGAIPRKGSQDFELAKSKMIEVVQSMDIEEIFAPHYLEGWSDHLAAYELAVELAKESKQSIEFYLYWVWVWYYIGIKRIFSLRWSEIYLLPIKSVYRKKQQALDVYFDSKAKNGELYIGNLPVAFLSAFKWKYEVFEKVNINDV